jgi:pyridoxine 4-dehydrogenase
VQLVHFRIFAGSAIPFTTSMETMFQLQREGKILHVGISNVSPGELKTAMQMGPVATVENMYGHAQRVSMTVYHAENRGGEEVLDICEENGIPLIPYFSLVNALPKNDDRIATIAAKYNASAIQINIAWLLHRSPWILPIPGTSSLAHFKENILAADIILTEEDMLFLD